MVRWNFKMVDQIFYIFCIFSRCGLQFYPKLRKNEKKIQKFILIKTKEQMNQQKLTELWNEMGKLKDEMAGKELKSKVEIYKGIAKINDENIEMKKKKSNLEEENLALKKKMTKMEAYMKELKLSIRRRQMPAELLNELFSSLPLENAFGILAKMPSGLLARNIQKIINRIKMAMKDNEWNQEDCGPRLVLSEKELLEKHFRSNAWNSVRAIIPIPIINLGLKKPSISFYFEVQIIQNYWNSISIGFCSQEFPIEGKWLGSTRNSFGINQHGEIWIDGYPFKLGNTYGSFNKGDVIGLGIIYSSTNSSMKCFSTLNGQLLGKAELKSKFVTIKLFPAITLNCVGVSIRTNFGKEKWRFNEFDQLLQ